LLYQTPIQLLPYLLNFPPISTSSLPDGLLQSNFLHFFHDNTSCVPSKPTKTQLSQESIPIEGSGFQTSEPLHLLSYSFAYSKRVFYSHRRQIQQPLRPKPSNIIAVLITSRPYLSIACLLRSPMNLYSYSWWVFLF